MTVDPQILADVITHRFSDRVQPRIGLMLELFDIVKAEECKSLPDTLVAYVTTTFRYIVFNPPIGSIWEGIIAQSDENGVYINLSFFRDIFVPFGNLPEGVEFSETDETWMWSQEDEGGEAVVFAFEVGEEVRFRVCEVQFPQSGEVLMKVVASMDSRTSGLGLKSWWVTPELAD